MCFWTAAKSFLVFAFLFGASLAHSACALSTEKHPSGVVGLQLFYADQAQSWQDADDLGVSWTRVELRWDWLQPNQQGPFDPSYADRVMALASAHGQKIMVLFNHVPQFAQKDTDLLPERAAAALTWLAKRHGARISAWELFNEPNLPGYGWPDVWATPQDSAIAYAKTLAIASGALRELDKAAFVISAGLSPANDPEAYARYMVRATPPECYDALALHPYSQMGRFAAVQRNAATLFQQEKRPIKPVWFTEYGTALNSQRAALLTSLAAEKANIPITFFFVERDLGQFTDQYGLRRKDGSAKADYRAFKQLITRP